MRVALDKTNDDLNQPCFFGAARVFDAVNELLLAWTAAITDLHVVAESADLYMDKPTANL